MVQYIQRVLYLVDHMITVVRVIYHTKYLFSHCWTIIAYVCDNSWPHKITLQQLMSKLYHHTEEFLMSSTYIFVLLW